MISRYEAEDFLRSDWLKRADYSANHLLNLRANGMPQSPRRIADARYRWRGLYGMPLSLG